MSNPRTVPLEKTKLGQVYVAGDLTSPLPLEKTDVTAQAVGPMVSVSVAQRFGNPLTEPAEIAYLFPLPHEAAIIDFELRVGDRIIRGDLQELEQAQLAYEEAVAEGRRAGLLEQRRPNLLSVRIGNVLPGETICTTMRYQARLGYDDGEYRFVFPMGITPKYHSAEHPDEGAGTDAPLAGADEPVGPVEVLLSIDAGAAAGEPVSPSHEIEWTRLDERRLSVRLAGHQIPDHDFVLRYSVAREAVASAAWAAIGEGGDYVMATVLPPALDEEDATPPPREFIFVLDRSGSMSGQPIAQARNALRACLRTLGRADLFRILVFDTQLEWFRAESSSVSQSEIDAADAFLGGVEGRGGTEIVRALEASLTLPPDPTRMRYILFLTDGAVSAEERALDLLRRQLGDARVFTFGIGPAVNRALLDRLATLGRGAAEFLQLDEDIEGAIIRFQDRVSFPILTDLTIHPKNCKMWDVYPRSLPDLYAGQPLEIVGRLIRSARGKPELIVTGRTDGKVPVEMRVALPDQRLSEPIVVRAWARARIDDLLEDVAMSRREPHKLRAEIIGLALEHRLVTAYTAFVAVDSEVAVKEGKPQTIHVSQPLPPGLDLAGFTGPWGPTAAAARMATPFPRAMQGFVDAAPLAGRADARRVSVDRLMVSQSLDSAEYLMDSGPLPAHEELPAVDDLEGTLRRLARTQKVNGSWADDVERTAAALLAFVRAGHTTKRGHFRKQVMRAVDWLSAVAAAGFGAFARAVALAELAATTGSEAHRQAASEALSELPTPGTPLQAAALARAKLPDDSCPGPDNIRTLDDLRLAGICRKPLPVPPGLLGGKHSDLIRAWAGAIAR